MRLQLVAVVVVVNTTGSNCAQKQHFRENCSSSHLYKKEVLTEFLHACVGVPCRSAGTSLFPVNKCVFGITLSAREREKRNCATNMIVAKFYYKIL